MVWPASCRARVSGARRRRRVKATSVSTTTRLTPGRCDARRRGRPGTLRTPRRTRTGPPLQPGPRPRRWAGPHPCRRASSSVGKSSACTCSGCSGVVMWSLRSIYGPTFVPPSAPASPCSDDRPGQRQPGQFFGIRPRTSKRSKLTPQTSHMRTSIVGLTGSLAKLSTVYPRRPTRGASSDQPAGGASAAATGGVRAEPPGGLRSPLGSSGKPSLGSEVGRWR
jgi:hypothetical protein